MSIHRQKTRKLTPLEAKWEAILESEGLGNIEHRESSRLRKYDSFYFKKFSKEEFKERELYYRLARELVYKDVFNSARDRRIWELHAEGLVDKEIMAKVKGLSPSVLDRRIALYRKYLVRK